VVLLSWHRCRLLLPRRLAGGGCNASSCCSSMTGWSWQWWVYAASGFVVLLVLCGFVAL
jgi:hypothetical protein